MMERVLEIIKDSTLTYEQTLLTLAREAENSIDVLNISSETQALRDEGIICDLFEGHAPYRPRYIVPDYEKFMKQGSQFLDLQPPVDLYDAINNLLILYKHVPSISSFPVYIGNIDKLLEPFVKDDEASFRAIKNFLKHIDRTVTDSFCHANIGPEETITGRLILRAERELQDAIPNITLKYDEKLTSDEFAKDAVLTALKVAKPSFANHSMFTEDLKGDYGIVSCYNGLKIGGGSYTLVRTNLHKLALKCPDRQEFFENQLPQVVKHMIDYMDERLRFLIDETPFFTHNFLVKEGLIQKDKFTAMFGMVGLADAVNVLLGNPAELSGRYGHSQEANELGLAIVERIQSEVNQYHNDHLSATGGKYLLHAQVGIDSDQGTTPGCRIPIGDEPEILEHVLQSAPFHKYFPSGIGDIFKFDVTAEKNPQYVLDIIKGGFKSGLRYFSSYSTESDVIRITGYLVKRSDMEKLDRGEQVLNDAVVLGLGAAKNARILERKTRT